MDKLGAIGIGADEEFLTETQEMSVSTIIKDPGKKSKAKICQY